MQNLSLDPKGRDAGVQGEILSETHACQGLCGDTVVSERGQVWEHPLSPYGGGLAMERLSQKPRYVP